MALEKTRDVLALIGSLKKDSYLLLPKSYPDFLPTSFKNENNIVFNINRVNMLEVSIDPDIAAQSSKTSSLIVESVMLEK